MFVIVRTFRLYARLGQRKSRGAFRRASSRCCASYQARRDYYLLDGGPDVLISIRVFDSVDEALAPNETAATLTDNVLEFVKGTCQTSWSVMSWWLTPRSSKTAAARVSAYGFGRAHAGSVRDVSTGRVQTPAEDVGPDAGRGGEVRDWVRSNRLPWGVGSGLRGVRRAPEEVENG